MKPIRKSLSLKSKAAKTSRTSVPAASKVTRTKKSPQGEADGPDERRPEVKADEIYGDTKIPERSRKP